MFRVHIANPNAGWMELVATTATEVRVLVSYTPNDFLAELIGALSLAVQGVSGVAVAMTEPDVFELVLEPQQDGAVSLTVVEYPGGRKGRGRNVLVVQGTPTEVVLPFWRALKSLQGRISPEEYARAMRREFPTLALQRLSRLLSKE